MTTMGTYTELFDYQFNYWDEKFPERDTFVVGVPIMRNIGYEKPIDPQGTYQDIWEAVIEYGDGFKTLVHCHVMRDGRGRANWQYGPAFQGCMSPFVTLWPQVRRVTWEDVE